MEGRVIETPAYLKRAEFVVGNTREIDHDRQTKAGAGLGFVQPLAAARDLGALGRRKPAPVIVDDNPQGRAGA